MRFKKLLSALVLTTSFALLGACSPEVGSKEWCDEMNQKPKDEWTTKDAKAFTEHCLF